MEELADRVVLDASVGVKWFRDEPGTDAARELLRRHGEGAVSLVVPSLFLYELMAVAERTLSAEHSDEFWSRFLSWRLGVVRVHDSLMRDALEIRRDLGCSLYDAVAPALARQLGATLASADQRAHGTWPGVRIIG
jgi:predicted nucleic acid-binding protein